MAITPSSEFPGKIAAPTTEFPYGKARDITTPGDGTGTPWRAALANDIFGAQQSLLSAADIVPSGTPDEVGSSQYLQALSRMGIMDWNTQTTYRIGGKVIGSDAAIYEALVEQAGNDPVGDAVNWTFYNTASLPQLAPDMDAVAASGAYYTEGTTTNRISTIFLGTVDVIFDHLQIDANSAMQRAVDYTNNVEFFRGKVGGVWQTWQQVTATSIQQGGWPTITTDNVITEVDTSTIVGWSNSGNVSTDGSILTFADLDLDYEYTIDALTGDYIMYMTLGAQSVAGSYVQFTLGGAGDGRIVLALGFNWETSSSEQNRVSVRFGTTGVAGPLIDYSVAPVEFALQYDSRVGAGNLFIKESGVWVFYGSAAMADPYRTTLRVSPSGGFSAEGYVHEWFTAKPNIVAIGDSVTAGHVLFDPDPAEYVGDDNYQSTWMAHAQLYGNIRNNLIVNYGVGADDSGQVNARVDAMLANTTPSVVFLSACNNDFGAAIPENTRTANIQSSVDKILAASARVVLYNAIYPNNSTVSRDYYLNWWTNNAAAIAGTSEVIDIMLSGIASGTNQIDPSFAADHVHPNVAGYTMIGDYVELQEP